MFHRGYNVVACAQAQVSYNCGCGGAIGCDCDFKLGKFGVKGHIRFYCRKNCGLNFNFTKFYKVQLPEKTEIVPSDIVQLFKNVATEALKKATRLANYFTLEGTITSDFGGKTHIYNLKGE